MIGAISYLVSRGFDEKVITAEYSVRKINALFLAAMHNDGVDDRRFGYTVRMGVNADSASFSKWVERI